MTRYKYSRYLGEDWIKTSLRVPRDLYERACKNSDENRQSFNKRVIELIVRDLEERQVVGVEK